MMKWLLLGYGSLSEKRVAAALQQTKGSELVDVWGRDADKCKDFADRHRIGRHSSGMDELGIALQKDIDAVYVCTPVDTHMEYAMQALNSGKHVLCEKPMAINVDQCQKMIHCAAVNNLKLGIAYYRRCFPNIMRFKELIDEGMLGDIIYVEMKFQEYYCPQEISQQYWRVLPEKAGGGVSFDVGSHRLDVLNYLFGDIKLISSQKANLSHDYPAEDTATFFMELENFNGAPAILNVSWACKNTIDRLVITGSNAIASIANLNEAEVKVIGTKGIDIDVESKAKNVHIPIVEDFVCAVDNDGTPVCDGLEGLKTNIHLESILDKK